MKTLRHRACAGFSLIEMVVSITVLAILSASAAVFMRGPITSYFDTERRANLSDMAGLTMVKLSQDIARAVPNSVRVSTVAGRVYIEFLPTTSEGRFRVGGPGNVLTLGSPDTGFDALLCVSPTGACAAGNWVVINNHLAGANVWGTTTSRASLGSLVGNTLTLAAAHTFASPPTPFDAPDNRFQIAGQPVTYVCDPNAANPALGTLRRYSNYGNPQLVQPTAFGAGVQNDLLADGIAACRAAQLPGTLRRAQVVSLALNFDIAGDRLNLAHSIRVEPLP
jgi:MSHA biogenesis protein MshO